MPRTPRTERVRGSYFSWLLCRRRGVYYADGRGNRPPLGRHSLRSRDRARALRTLADLDARLAADCGLALRLPTRPSEAAAAVLPLSEGAKLYLDFAGRPPVQGGVAPRSLKRYRTVLDKFIAFAAKQSVLSWHQINKDILTRYGQWLEERNYHDRSQYTELTVLKSVLKWMAAEGRLPPSCAVRMPLRKPHGSSTYCYSPAQVRAVIDFVRSRPILTWLADVVVALSTTGLRIGELAELRWADVDMERGVLSLQDTSRRTRRSERALARTTKSHRGRSLPLHPELRKVLAGLPRRPDGRVFGGPRGGRLKPDTVRVVLRRDVLASLAEAFPAQGDDPGIAAGRVHSFRHYFCSAAADYGVPEQMLMSWLGHRDSDMIRHYYHLRQDQARRHMQLIPFVSGESARGAGENRIASTPLQESGMAP